jgi:hypothetical protein
LHARRFAVSVKSCNLFPPGGAAGTCTHHRDAQMEMLLVYWNVTWADHNVRYTAKVTYPECHHMIASIVKEGVQVLGHHDQKTGICYITVFQN